ncbi:hypothetical protein [Sphingomonas sp. G-3-2-10]|uniref:hypothetical protein n=1 Tax=Sphingomonas sp. G-3-2-10 TaxID=2728838 RepID=UPI00146B2D6D|nr:hypothetical protein [Sphingomonas sp. G-3-2-10]NML05141.1 hypothetical protein [Sphingomonas sp. G-3-2-10]
MRLMIAAGALLALASPALAQRVDTRRIDIREMGTNTICSFNAFRDLTLIDASKSGKASVGRWKGASDASASPPAYLEAVFTASKDRWFDAPFIGVAFSIEADAALSTSSVSGARAVIDGDAPVDLLYHASGDKLSFPVPGDPSGFARRLIRAKTLRLDILGRDGNVAATRTWSIRRFGEAVEVVSIVGWKCDTP